MVSGDVAVEKLCDLSVLKPGSPAYDWQFEACENAKAQQVDREKRYAFADRIKALLRGECDRYFQAPDGLERLEKHRPHLAAGLYMRGLCAPKNTAKAQSLLTKRLEQYPSDSTAMAQLGALYWTGGEADRAKARELFHLAALHAVPRLFQYDRFERVFERYLGPDPYAMMPDEGALWSFTDRDLVVNFAIPELGPWDMPEPLQEQRAWLSQIHRSSDDAIVEIGVNLLDGLNGYPQLPWLAYDWLSAAASVGQTQSAYYLFLILSDPQVAKRIAVSGVHYRTIDDPMAWARRAHKCEAPSYLEEAARAGHQRALLHALALLEAQIEKYESFDIENFFGAPEKSPYEFIPLPSENVKYNAVRDAVWGYHGVVHLLLNNGYVIPRKAAQVARRLVMEAQNLPGLDGPAVILPRSRPELCF